MRASSIYLAAALVGAASTSAYARPDTAAVDSAPPVVCPSYTHKDDVKLGTPGALPEGWYAFRREDQYGLWKSPLRTWYPVVIPNTEFDIPHSIDISDDGGWIVYVHIPEERWATPVTYLIRPDGTGKTEVPTAKQVEGFTRTITSYASVAGFYRGSPYGSEVFFLSGAAWIFAKRVELSGPTPILDTADRTIADLGGKYISPNWASSQVAVVRDEIYGRFDKVDTVDPDRNIYPFSMEMRNARPGFLTIPDSGRGVAGPRNMFVWANDTDMTKPYDTTNMWGCGFTISGDGKLCLANSALIGSTCVPNKKSGDFGMDHKGFIITRFLRYDEPPIFFNDQIDSPAYGVSINWCPERYRAGSYDEIDFSDWAFTNDSKYVVGRVSGNRLVDFGLFPGVWVVEWQTNTWTQVTPDSLRFTPFEPALFVGATFGARVPLSRTARPALHGAQWLPAMTGAAVAMGARHTRVQVYSLRGALLWEHHRESPGAASVVRMPGRLKRMGPRIVKLQ